MQAKIQDGITASGSQIACSNCHRRSGLGSSESGINSPPVTAERLFRDEGSEAEALYGRRNLRADARPAYTNESLARAIVQGIDPTGASLHALMPRYELGSEALAAITAYLRSMSATPSPGVTDSDLHIATVVTDDATPADRASMLAVLEAFFADKNAGTRGEARRARYAPTQRKWHYAAHRNWRLHVWELTGAAHGWRQQLDRLYAAQPVFALVSGVSASGWKPVHDFCEREAVPCLFPNTALPALGDRDYYTVYFSRGVTQDAGALVRHLVDEASSPAAGERTVVMQVARNTELGLGAANALRAAAQRHPQLTVVTRIVDENELTDQRLMASLETTRDVDHVVLWLGPEVPRLLAELSAAPQVQPKTIVVSSRFLGQGASDALARLGGDIRSRIRIVHPFALDATDSRSAHSIRRWLGAKGIEMQNARIELDTHYAVTMLARAVKHMAGNFSRDYLLEKIEHQIDKSLHTAMYEHLSLGPSQRYASKRCQILALHQDPDKPHVRLNTITAP
ncbi:MAG: hypothetical protein ACR2RL_16995 [Gammaproteobacteria bacterium]